ncbi:unnamed protein product [Phyllotreta striolata]|uniref:Carboxypeptidase n=1 Tax=Phyllotreta striolata TaxID=444603 RepID=A0A9N9U1V1_PHYSR|nr:unnamed protein product [Phyllotreta striolata]
MFYNKRVSNRFIFATMAYTIPLLAAIACLYVANVDCFTNVYPKLRGIKREYRDAGEPLFLTPLIEANKTEEAREASAVPSDVFLGVKSHSGFFTVDKTFNSNMFFWFFPADHDYENAPVLLWLQGGPGATSLAGLFEENGPFALTKSYNLKRNEFSWTLNHSVIYIDNPVQTGYSFTEGGFARNQTKVGQDLYEALRQFFLVFPELRRNEFYATGESYAGKYVPAVSYAILKNNPRADAKINLKGMAIGNGLCDPVHQLNYGGYLYEIGLIDKHGRTQFAEYERKGINYIKKKEFLKAFEIFDDLLNGDLNDGKTLFKNLTGFDYYFDYLYTNSPNELQIDFSRFVQREDIRKAIHVGSLTFNDGNAVEENLKEDVMDSVAPWISVLLSNIRVMFYNGQMDIIVPYPLTVNFLNNLPFSGSDEYKIAPRRIWRYRDDIPGYVKQAGNLTEVLVRNAGHMVPSFQPEWALDLITKFTRNQPLHRE